MRKFIFVFLSLSCFASEPKYHFKDCVEVVGGFYGGCKGTVQEYTGLHYGVGIDCKNEEFYGYFKEEDLKSSTGCKK